MSIHLSPRQHEIAQLVVQGLSNKAIARELKLSPNTVQEYMLRISKRIGGEGRPRMRIFRYWYSVNYEKAA